MTETSTTTETPRTEHAWDGNGFCQIHGQFCSWAADSPETEDEG